MLSKVSAPAPTPLAALILATTEFTDMLHLLPDCRASKVQARRGAARRGRRRRCPARSPPCGPLSRRPPGAGWRRPARQLGNDPTPAWPGLAWPGLAWPGLFERIPAGAAEKLSIGSSGLAVASRRR